MTVEQLTSGSYTRDDGFGTRQLAEEPELGLVEILDLTPVLATSGAEQAIRARVGQLEGFGAPVLAPVHKVERDGDRLSVISTAVDGVPLCELLAALEFGTLTLPNEAILELAAITVRTVGAMHEKLGPLAHGALNPAHVVLQRDGSVVLTDAVFGDALQQLELNRDDLWRTFSLAMPAAATLARFDRRSDVTQLGSVVLAILLRRTLLAHEYPRPVADLVTAAAAENGAAAAGTPRLRTWLQQALQLQPRAVFPSAVEAAQVFADVLDSVSARRGGTATLNSAIRRLLGETTPSQREPDAAPAPGQVRPVPAEVATQLPAVASPAPSPRGFSFLRSVLPHLRAN